MNRIDLVRLMRQAALNMPSTDFSAGEVQEAASTALLKYAGLSEDATYGQIFSNKEIIFEVINEVIDDVVPAKVAEKIGAFAEIKTFKRNQAVYFTIKGTGKNRVKKAIVAGAKGGLYRAHRLDSKEMSLTTKVETVSYATTLEDILTGQFSISEVVAAIAEGFVEKTYFEVMTALRGMYASVPAANKATIVNSAEISYDDLDELIRVAGAYGSPIVIGFKSFLGKIQNVTTSVINSSNVTPNIAGSDLEEIKANGIVRTYKGTQLVEIPNYFVDETNSKWVFKEGDMFILPSDTKPVKVAYKGASYTEEIQTALGGREWHTHRLVGVGVLFYNNVCIYRDSRDTVIDGLY